MSLSIAALPLGRKFLPKKILAFGRKRKRKYDLEGNLIILKENGRKFWNS